MHEMTNEALAQRIGCASVAWQLFDGGRDLGVSAKWDDGTEHALRIITSDCRERSLGTIDSNSPPMERDFVYAVGALREWKTWRESQEWKADRG